MAKISIIALLLVLLMLPAVSAQKGQIKLLAITEKAEARAGAVVDLLLEIKPGSGKVFLETFPLIQITTQASLRFAKQIACDELQLNCNEKDFFFTISGVPGVVSGPSAGAAAAGLVAALMLGLRPTDDIAVTGTINPGGIVGNVGGVEEKVKAAAAAGIKKVLIPVASPSVKLKGVEVIEVSSLADVVFHLTGVKIERKENITFEVDRTYLEKMKKIAMEICSEAAGIKIAEAANFAALGQAALANESYYSASSFCFRAKVLGKEAEYARLSWEGNAQKRKELEKRISDALSELEKRQIGTITDLQVYMLVQERFSEAKEVLDEIKAEPNLEKANKNLAYAEVRAFSAEAWSIFFNGKDRVWNITDARLKRNCEIALAEAEERHNYAAIFAPIIQRKDLEAGYSSLEKEDFITCLLQAAKAKANADLMLTLVGVEEVRIPEILDAKITAAAAEIAAAQAKNVFPIASIAYHEYAKNLRQLEPLAALRFAQLALELAAIDIYFIEGVSPPPAPELKPEVEVKPNYLIYALIAVAALAAGIAIGLALKPRPVQFKGKPGREKRRWR